MSRCTLFNRVVPKVMAVLLVLTLLLPLAPAAAAAELSGTCGKNLEWSFADGTLTITGKGDMENYSERNFAPWYSFRREIVKLVLPEGLTSVGSLAFYDCTALKSIVLPAKVERIGELAFCQCRTAEILVLNEGLTNIGRSAFEQCESIRELRLPQSLKTIGRQAFYWCISIPYVTVPSGVTEMGESAFSYCHSLIRADIKAPLTELPSWTFFGCDALSSISLQAETTLLGDRSIYGCEKLTVVYYGGTAVDAQELQEQIEAELPGSQVSQEKPGNSESSNGSRMDENDEVVVEDTTVTRTENSTITVTTENNISNEDAEQAPTRVSATIVTDEGWDELMQEIEGAMTDAGVILEIYLPENPAVPTEVIDLLAGKDVRMKVTTAKGASYTLNLANMKDLSTKKPLDMSYTLTLMENIKYERLRSSIVYELAFAASSKIPLAVAIQLPVSNSRSTASLFQVRGDKLELLQSAVVAPEGIAYFYLASVDKGTTYFIGINVTGIEDAYIPQSLEGEYGITEQIRDVDYVVTGRYSSWGLTSAQVTRILIGFMLSTASVVGLLMYALNKRKLRRGYTPGWDEEDDAETE